VVLFNWVHEFLSNPASLPHQFKRGYYNTNYLVQYDAERYVIRVPIANVQSMDQAYLNENEVLKMLQDRGYRAPRFLWKDEHFSVHSYIDSRVVDDIFPEGSALPDWIIQDLAQQTAAIHKLNSDFTNPPITVQSVAAHIRMLYNRYDNSLKDLFDEFRFPSWAQIVPNNITHQTKTSLRTVFSHCDIHRSNVILSKDGFSSPVLTIIDWEQAKIAPIEYDLATQFHKSGYTQEQEQIFLNEYIKNCHNLDTINVNTFFELINIYKKLEAIKSAIVDTVRTLDKVQREEVTHPEISIFANKLEAAHRVWNEIKNDSTICFPSKDVYSILAKYSKVEV
jgi:aminoglycoside phosphotransferase (APT) family kinase protein